MQNNESGKDRAERERKLRTVLVPRVFQAAGGKFAKATDGTLYRVLQDGSWRRAQQKVSGKAAKRARRAAREAG